MYDRRLSRNVTIITFATIFCEEEETKGEIMSNRLHTILQEKNTQIHEQS